MKRKLLALAVAVIFILGTVATGFAATFEDVEDTKYEKAVTRLNALDIIGGFPDGTFRPDEPATRAQFAKIIVTAMGVGDAANYAQGSTKFSDVPSNHWASGFINVATDMGVIKGRPDGTFGPEDQVTYAEAITMIVRALGYEPAAQAKGGYPGGYLAIAAEKEITKNVKIVSTMAANRGDVAVMVDNSLDVNLMEQVSYGDEARFQEVDKTLLEDKLNTNKYEDVIVTAIPRFNDGLNDNEIEVTGNLDEDSADETGNFTILTDIVEVDIDSLFGRKVDIYVNDDDEIFYLGLSSDFKVYYDEIDPDGPDSDEAGAVDKDVDGKKGKITLVKADDDFKLADEDDLVVYAYAADGSLIDDIDSYADLENYIGTQEGIFGKFVVNDDNEIQYIELYKWNEADAAVVLEVDAKHETITVFNFDEDEEEIDLTDEDGYKVLDTNFNALELDDIEKYNVVYIQKLDHEASGDTLFYVFVVTDNTAEGELEEYADDDHEIQVEGKTYDIGRVATISIDNDDTIIDKMDSGFYGKVDDSLDEEVVVVFDLVGNVRHISTEAEASSDDMYGIVTGTKTEFDDEFVKIFTQDGEEVVYQLDIDEDESAVKDLGDLDVDSDNDLSDDVLIVKYTLDSDGDIETMKVIANAAVGGNTPLDVAEDGIDNSSIETTEPEIYIVEDDAVIFDIEEYRSTKDVDDIDILKWTEINDKDSGSAGDVKVFVDPDSKKVAKALFFTQGIQDVGEDEFAGYAIDVRTTSKGDKVKVDVFGEGIKEYYLKTDGSVDDESIVLFTLNADDELIAEDLETLTAPYATVSGYVYDYATVSGYVYDIDGNYISFAKTWTDDGDGEVALSELSDLTAYYKVVSDTVIYEDDDKMDKYDLDECDEVEVLVENKEIKVLKIK